jgi:hypothetical protein
VVAVTGWRSGQKIFRCALDEVRTIWYDSRMMKRTNHHLRDDQRDWLKAEGIRIGVKPAEIVRDFIDEGIDRRNRKRTSGQRVRRTVTRAQRRKAAKADDR